MNAGIPHRRGANLFGQVVFIGLLVVMILAVIPYGSVDAWWEAVFECGVWLLAAIWILKVSFYGESNLRQLLILLPLILITLYAFAQTAVLPVWLARGFTRLTAQRTLTIDRYQTYITARKMLALTLFLALLFLHTSSPSRLRWLTRVVIGLGLGSALFGILRQVLQSPDATIGFVLPFLFPGVGYGQFISPNVFAYLMEMTLALMLGLVLGGGVQRQRVLIYLAMSLPVWAALVLSNSRGGIVGLVCSVIIVLFTSLNWYQARAAAREGGEEQRWPSFLRSSPLIRVLLVAVVVVIFLVGVFWIGGESLSTKSQRESTAEANAGMSRRDIWRASWTLVKKNPWTGVGFGDYFLAIPQYHMSTGTTRLEEAHEDYLDLAANGGLVAVILAGWLFINVIRRIRLTLRSRDVYRRAVCLGASAGILSICIHSFVDFGLQVTGIAVVFCALIVIAVADKSVETPARKYSRVFG